MNLARGTEIVVPSISILAEPPVALVGRNADRHGTRKVAEEYLNYLYSDAGQEIAAKHYYRPRSQAIAKEYANKFAQVNLFTIDEVFGSWKAAQSTHSADGAPFDQIYGN